MFDAVYRPGIALGSYPERKDSQRQPFDAALLRVLGYFKRPSPRGSKAGLRFVAEVESLANTFGDLSDTAFKQRCLEIHQALQHHGYETKTTAQAFAAVREASARILGKRHYETQLLGGWVLLKGYVAEMQTGEGKTITALLPACTAAMAGVPVHVITANDYLAARDVETLAPVYEWFGLTVGVLTDEVREPAARKAIYDCNLTYCSPRQVAFDYLRDRMTMGHRRDQLDHKIRAFTGTGEAGPPLLMRGLCFAIVDEADSVLIDDAGTPLILSQQVADAPEIDNYAWALAVAGQLEAGADFRVNRKYREVVLNKSGHLRLAELTEENPVPGVRARERELLIAQALQALHCYRRDHEYLVRDGRIEIIDGNTGRAQPDHAWQRGLHQMIEAKESCELTPPRKTIARMSYQRFFRRYLHLGGMSGTVREVAHELSSVYRLEVLPIPTHRPSQRVSQSQTIHATAAHKWQAVAERAAAMQRAGRPTLIGTQSVEESEVLSDVLTAAGVTHTGTPARIKRKRP